MPSTQILSRPARRTTNGFVLQPELFKDDYVAQYDKEGYLYEFPQVGDVTFLNGVSSPVHRWFRLTPSYSPDLVKFLLKELNCDENTLVCDPFLGKGTTAIETKRMGIPFIGVELNPLLKIVSEYALTWEVDSNRLEKHFRRIENEIVATLTMFQSSSIDQVLEKYRITLPPIHDVFRWWKKYVLKDLLIIQHLIEKISEEKYTRLYRLALCSSVLDCANIHRNHPTISFDDDHAREINVLQDFTENMRQIINDLAGLTPAGKLGNAKIVLGDSTKIATFINRPINRVITSPPYPNRFSYVHTTRPQLFFMKIFQNATQSADLDCAAIGGTWGKATSILYKQIIEPHEHLRNILSPIINELRPKNNLMCNYVVKYFNMIDEHIRELRKIVGKDFRGAYVVGNSRLAGVEIVTELILAKIFALNGYSVEKLLVFRKRGGKKNLYETAVCINN